MDCFIVSKWDGFIIFFGCKYTYFFDHAKKNIHKKIIVRINNRGTVFCDDVFLCLY